MTFQNGFPMALDDSKLKTETAFLPTEGQATRAATAAQNLTSSGPRTSPVTNQTASAASMKQFQASEAFGKMK